MTDTSIENREELIQELCIFFECAIHNILYIREVFPVGLFKKVKIYNVPVFKCRHPSVVVYIKNIMDSIRPLFVAELIDKLCLVICRDGPSRKPLEQFTFSLKLLPDFRNCTRASLDTFLRSFLLKINVADSMLQPIERDGNDISFYVLLHTNSDLDSAHQRRLQGMLENPWVSADDEEKVLFKGANVAPCKTITTQSFQLQLHVEQISVDSKV
jgi:mitotic spindle assembly checkpoint protein MAD2B